MANSGSSVPSLWHRLPALLRDPSCFLGAISLAAHFMTSLHQLLLLTRTQGIPSTSFMLTDLPDLLLPVCYTNITSAIPKPCQQACDESLLLLLTWLVIPQTLLCPGPLTRTHSARSDKACHSTLIPNFSLFLPRCGVPVLTHLFLHGQTAVPSSAHHSGSSHISLSILVPNSVPFHPRTIAHTMFLDENNSHPSLHPVNPLII